MSEFMHFVSWNLTILVLSGETVPPSKVDNVTMLFSDIVGFTSICSTATPLQVIAMLSSLYTNFDQLCELLDIYKVCIVLTKSQK